MCPKSIIANPPPGRADSLRPSKTALAPRGLWTVGFRPRGGPEGNALATVRTEACFEGRIVPVGTLLRSWVRRSGARGPNGRGEGPWSWGGRGRGQIAFSSLGPGGIFHRFSGRRETAGQTYGNGAFRGPPELAAAVGICAIEVGPTAFAGLQHLLPSKPRQAMRRRPSFGWKAGGGEGGVLRNRLGDRLRGAGPPSLPRRPGRPKRRGPAAESAAFPKGRVSRPGVSSPMGSTFSAYQPPANIGPPAGGELPTRFPAARGASRPHGDPSTRTGGWGLRFAPLICSGRGPLSPGRGPPPCPSRGKGWLAPSRAFPAITSVPSAWSRITFAEAWAPRSQPYGAGGSEEAAGQGAGNDRGPTGIQNGR